jgi:hypothetical protein
MAQETKKAKSETTKTAKAETPEQAQAETPEQANDGATAAQNPLSIITAEVVTQMARSAAGELVKGQQPISQVARTVVDEAAQTLEQRGPKAAEEAGILNWRYAALGWVTWHVGKRVLKRKAEKAFARITKRELGPAKASAAASGNGKAPSSDGGSNG